MACNISVVEYTDEYEEKWDKFVTEGSLNGTFLQTRRFLNYHPEGRFTDNSLIFLNGNEIVAVLPADKKDNSLISHEGSTFGGIVIGKGFCKITVVEALMEAFDRYVGENNFGNVVIKQTGPLFCRGNCNLLDYFLFKEGFKCAYEVGFAIDLSACPEDVIQSYSAGRRRDYRYSLKNNFSFKEIGDETEIRAFYNILCDNYRKFNANPIHSVNELIEFKKERLVNETAFFGVFSGEEMIAGSMVFYFDTGVFHTQYLAVSQDKKDLFVNEFLYTSLIETARDRGFKKISFGTSTLEGGRVLNKPLALYKEGFGTEPFINNIYSKEYIRNTD